MRDRPRKYCDISGCIQKNTPGQRICADHQAKFAEARAQEVIDARRAKRKKRPAVTSEVYFVLAPGHRRVKIGKADKVEKRFRELEAMSPVPLILLGSITGGVYVERWCHSHCIEDRSHYEWFKTTPRTESFIRLVLSHGKSAAEFMCLKHLKADKLHDDGSFDYPGTIGALPSQKFEWAKQPGADRAAEIGVCPCRLCSDYLEASK